MAARKSQSAQPAVDPALIAAVMAAMQAQSADEPADEQDDTPTAAVKASRVAVPSFTVKGENDTSYRVTVAHESRPGHKDSTKYRVPRIRIDSKLLTADDYRKVCTISADVLNLLVGLNAKQVEALNTYIAKQTA